MVDVKREKKMTVKASVYAMDWMVSGRIPDTNEGRNTIANFDWKNGKQRTRSVLR